jgi:hypothetical protein
MPIMSSEFKWDLERPEKTVECLEGIFDVQKAKNIIAQNPREVEDIDLVKHKDYFTSYLDEVKLKPNVNWETVDCSLPLIFVRLPQGKLQIDGKRRLKKAMDSGLESIPAVFLTLEETKEVQVI